MIRNKLTYKLIIQDEVQKQSLAAKTTRGYKSYMARVSAESWIRTWIDLDMAKELIRVIKKHAKDKRKARQVIKMIKELMENKEHKYDMYTKMLYDKEKIYANIDNFFTPEKPPLDWNEHFIVAVEIVRSILHSAFTGYLTPKRIYKGMDLKEVLSKDKTAMGYLCLDSKKRDEPELLINVALKLKEIKPQDPIIIAVYNRIQIGGGVNPETGELTPETLKNKYRAVCGVDGAVSLLEATYAKPFLEHVFSKINQYAGAKDPATVNSHMQAWFLQTENWTSGDFEKFDQTVPSWLISQCFALIAEFYPDEEDKEMLKWLEYQFIHAKFLYHDGSERQKHKGILSGSQFTQIVGSLANMIVILSALAKVAHDEVNPDGRWNERCTQALFFSLTGIPLSMRKVHRPQWWRIRMMVMGDDNIFFLNKKPDVEFLSSYIQRNYGMKLHVDKTSQFEKDGAYYPDFLKREWRHGGAYRNIYELIINMLTPERVRTYDGYSPIHILYGYYLTYNLAFDGLFSTINIIEELGGSDKILQLGLISPSDLPGSLRVLVMHDNSFINRMAKDAAAFERSEAEITIGKNESRTHRCSVA